MIVFEAFCASQLRAKICTEAQDPQPLPFIDGLRVAALALLLPHHVGMYYLSWPWHVKSPASSAAAPWLEPLMLLTSPWRLGLLFFVAGAAGQMLLARRGALAYAKDRSLG